MIKQIFPLGFTHPCVRNPAFQQKTPALRSDWRVQRVITLFQRTPCEIMLFTQGKDMLTNVVKKVKKSISLQIHTCSWLTDKPQQVSREGGTITMVLKTSLPEQELLTPSPQSPLASSGAVRAGPCPTLCLNPGGWTHATEPPRLCPGLTCLFSHFCPRITAELIFTALCPPPDSCIRLQKPRLVELVFWLLFKAIVPVKPQGPSGMRSFGVDEWASPTVGLAVTPGEGKGFGYLHFPPDRYVNYFPPGRYSQEHHLLQPIGGGAY